MGTWRSAAPRGQFGDQAGDTIFTSNRPISSRCRLRRDGFRERTTQLPPGHFGRPTRRTLAACPNPHLVSQCPPHLHYFSLAQSQQAWPPKSNWPLPSHPQPVLMQSTFISPETAPALYRGLHVHLAPSNTGPNQMQVTTSSGISSFLESTPNLS